MLAVRGQAMILALVVLAIAGVSLTLSGRRYAWGLLAIAACSYLLPPLGIPFIVAWLIGLAACFAVNSLPVWRLDPPQSYIALAIRALVSPLKARRAWWRVIRADGGQNLIVFTLTASEDRAAIRGQALPVTVKSSHGELRLMEALDGRRWTVCLALAGPPRRGHGKREKARFVADRVGLGQEA